MMDRLKIIIILMFTTGVTSGQTGGDNTYEFLNLSHYALITGLGGSNVSLWTDDHNMAYYNPALLNESGLGQISLNYVNYFAGINYGSAAYTGSYKDFGNFLAGISYFNYGNFNRADPSGIISGSFRAAEYAFNLIWSYKVDTMFNIGINFKPVISQLERYTSLGLAFDLGAAYHSTDGLLSAGLTLRNVGFQLTTYTGTRERLPFEIIAGISGKLEHAPFRFSLTVKHLEKYDMTYDYSNGANTTQAISGFDEFSENIMRHLILGTEFIPTKNFFLLAGFNYQRRKELLEEAMSSTVGFSWGFGIKLSAFDLTFGRSRYHLAGSINNFSLIVKPASFIKKN
jgi:hypothetical protein